MAATNRSESVFEVPPASAVVPDTAVAETVSYWASHGVQTAELTLDGFGVAPVEVSILLNGDQAQIDFRTDQAGVRQVLENAAAQLKDMLSSQGLQLAGVSVGSSGMGGDAGGDRRQRPAAQQITLVKTDAVGASIARAANPAVGRSLDLFV
jgi:flagellar hook-length control protein FliK